MPSVQVRLTLPVEPRVLLLHMTVEITRVDMKQVPKC